MGVISFERLTDAVSFLADHLDARDVDGIAAQCSDAEFDAARTAAPLPPPRSYRLTAIGALGRRHEARNLRSLYQAREFPGDASTFKLGGHEAELGHIHIDFVRTKSGWSLKEIWICR